LKLRKIGMELDNIVAEVRHNRELLLEEQHGGNMSIIVKMLFCEFCRFNGMQVGVIYGF